MVIVGVRSDGNVAFERALPHGGDPEMVAYQAGFRTVRPVDAQRIDGELVLRLDVELAPGPPPRRRPRGQDSGLVLDSTVVPVRRQRFAAYAVVRSGKGLLATEYSGRTAVAGRWGMPGGGVDEDEQPRAAVIREVAEETSQLIDLGALTRVQTSHWVGTSPRGVVEDFHAVRMIYTATCEHPTDPVLVDVGGTTASTRWIPIDTWREVTWTVGWREILRDLLVDSA